MYRRFFVLALFLFITTAAAFLLPNTISTAFTLTIPTRTPEPPDDGGGDGGGNGGNGGGATAPTDTPVPPTATNTPVPVTIAATPEGGFLATAVPCGEQPTIQALNTTRVRSGPGTDYDVVAEMVYLEVRTITGRAETANWWQIELEDGTRGWVSDEVVVVQGNTSAVPIVPPPAIDGETPTPGAPWTPVNDANCDVLPTWTPTATDTAVPPTDTPASDPTATDTPVPEAAPTDTAVPPTDTPTPTEAPTESATSTPQPTAVPLAVDTDQTNVGWLPIVALILLGGGVVAFLVPRLRNRG